MEHVKTKKTMESTKRYHFLCIKVAISEKTKKYKALKRNSNKKKKLYKLGQSLFLRFLFC